MRNPFLPLVATPLRAQRIRALNFSDSDLYLLRLRYAQSLLAEQKPAQSILQLNKALAVPQVDEETLADWPLPFGGLLWILKFTEKGFLGNPVRHFQHYATRLSGQNKELRRWRAWACYWISRTHLSEDEFPNDCEQIQNEQLIIPEIDQVTNRCDTPLWLRFLN